MYRLKQSTEAKWCRQCFCFQGQVYYFLDVLVQFLIQQFLQIMKINIFRGDLTCTSANKDPQGTGLSCADYVLKVSNDLQGHVPVRIIVDESATGRCPAVIWLHATGGDTEEMMPRLVTYARMGFVAVSMDCRYATSTCLRHSLPLDSVGLSNVCLSLLLGYHGARVVLLLDDLRY